jgi:hypothetical protein
MSKRCKLDLESEPEQVDDNLWHSASSVHNYILNDPLLDLLKYNDLKNGPLAGPNTIVKDESDEIFYNYILDIGNRFEKAIIEKIIERCNEISELGPDKDKVKVIFKQICFNQNDIKLKSSFEKTIQEISKGTPVIYQGSLHSEKMGTYGSPDLIIRTDYLNKIFNDNNRDHNDYGHDRCELNDYGHDHAQTYGHNKSYSIVDIKFSSLKLRSDGLHILNSGRMKANKGQLYIYYKMLSELVSTGSNCYILGRSYLYIHCKETFRSNNAFEKLGHINFNNIDKEYSSIVENALKWLTLVKKNINSPEWSISNLLDRGPIRPELYPNMSNKYDLPYNKFKKILANKINELTLVYSIGYEQRLIAFENGIRSWSDPSLTYTKLGLKDTPRTKLIMSIIDVQKDPEIKYTVNNLDLVKKMINYPKQDPSESKQNPGDVRDPSEPVQEFYIDFETIGGLFDDMSKIPESNKKDIVFMIGLGHKNKDLEFEYLNLKIPQISDQEEFEMFDLVLNKIKEISNGLPHVIYHWGHVEKTIFDNISKRYSRSTDLNFCDLMTVFTSGQIAIKGSLNYSLKDICKNLANNGLIAYNKIDNISGGLSAMIKAEKYYSDILENKHDPQVMLDIIEYNKLDCILLYEVLKFLMLICK